MPPKKKAAPTKETPAKVGRRSKLAKDNDITAEQEAAVKSVWQMFSLKSADGYEDEKEGVIRTEDVQKALKAQNIAPKSRTELNEFREILDPDSEGYVTYPHFVELSALQINNKSEETKAEEVDSAFKLFTKGRERPITLQDLRVVAQTLKEDVSDDVLEAMILEANGGQDVRRGVDVEAFKEVMIRAGAFQ